MAVAIALPSRASRSRNPSPAASAARKTSIHPQVSLSKHRAHRNTSLHPAVYVVTWICLSSGVIMFNKWILHNLHFEFPILLTTWHLIFATIATRILANTTTLLDGRHAIPMNTSVLFKVIAPIGLFFSLSLVFSNKAYLYLGIAFIQMIKATTPTAVLFTTWAMDLKKPDLRILANICWIVFGVMIASYGELNFHSLGFLFQAGGIIFEAIRLVMVERLLSSPEYKMDPLVSLYYFAPVCAIMNIVAFFIFEAGKLAIADILNVGPTILIVNAAIAFALNVCVVFMIGKTSSLVLTLCGVLKDILLIIASMTVWGTPVTALQFFGYSIALGGLLVYKFGLENVKHGVTRLQAGVWSSHTRKFPILQKTAVAVLILVLILWGLSRLYFKPIELQVSNLNMEALPPYSAHIED